ncbi:UNVERIFIED_CONTAM: hypothetical protein FKN15_038533 [Acipenser sinensis]
MQREESYIGFYRRKKKVGSEVAACGPAVCKRSGWLTAHALEDSVCSSSPLPSQHGGDSAVALTVSVDCTLKEFFQTRLLLDWTESVEACRQNITELVTMQSEEEYQEFWSYINLYEGLYWIGLQYNSSNINNTWEWVNGNPTTYSHWAEPPTGAGCGAFNSSSGGWFIDNCLYKLMSVCQDPSPPGKILLHTVENDLVSLSWGNPVDPSPPGKILLHTVENDLVSLSWGNPVAKPSPPGEIRIDSVGNNSVSLSWGSPVGMDGVQYSFNITYSCSFWGHSGSTSAPSNSTVISNMRPGSEYVFNIITVQDTGSQSTPASISLYTKPSSPGEIMIVFVASDSVSLCWGYPVGMEDILHSFNITYFSSFWGHQGWTTALSNSITISNLRVGSEYVFNITTVQDNGGQSTPASISLFTKPSSPGEIMIISVEIDSVSLSWGNPVDMDEIPHNFNISYCSFWGHHGWTTAMSNSITISTLRAGSEYIFNVTTVQDNGGQSTPTSMSLYLDPTPPGAISVDFVGSDSVSLSWGSPFSMDGVQYSFNITYSCAFWGHSGSTIAPSNSIVISTLNSGSEYVFNITTVQDTGSQSTPASISLYTRVRIRNSSDFGNVKK